MGFDDLSLFNAGTTNNGNVASMSANGAQTFNRTYTYDSLNRLLTLSAPGDPCSGLSWTYDAWGNRTDQNVTGGTCNSFHQLADIKNRLSGAGYQYDAAGNMTNDGSHSYTYDAENRIIGVDGGSALYVYDAQGHRVRKITGSTWTDCAYDASGNVVTEFTSPVGACSPVCWSTSYIYMNGTLVAEYKDGTTYFVHKDHLGSTRLLSKMDRTLKDSMDFLPYGEQIAGATGTTHKFTGKERDGESNLDYFGARYYSSAMGRFMSPDWDGKPATVPYAAFGDPQSLNLYSYVRNSPIVRIDADGHNYAGWNGAYADTTGGLTEVDYAADFNDGIISGTLEAREQQQQQQQQQSSALAATPPDFVNLNFFKNRMADACKKDKPPDVITAGVGGDIGFVFSSGIQIGAAGNGKSGELGFTFTHNVDLVGTWVSLGGYAYSGAIKHAPTNAAVGGGFDKNKKPMDAILSVTPHVNVAIQRTGVSINPQNGDYALTFGPSITPATVMGGASRTGVLFNVPKLGYIMNPMRAVCTALGY